MPHLNETIYDAGFAICLGALLCWFVFMDGVSNRANLSISDTILAFDYPSSSSPRTAMVVWFKIGM